LAAKVQGMEELLELREYIEHARYAEALSLLGEMEEMSRDEKINKIESFMEILLIHLIKQHAEKRSTRSWEVSIKNAVHKIGNINRRRKAGGYYLDEGDLQVTLEEAWETALAIASLETLEGCFDEMELAGMINGKQIKYEAMRLILGNG